MKREIVKFSSVLLLLTAAVTAVSCGDTAGQVEGNTGTQTEAVTEPVTEELSEIEQRKYMKDNLPEKDYGGKEFRVSTKSGTLYEVYTEEEDGDLINDALFARNRAVEERFNVVITPIITNDNSGTAQVDQVKKTVLSGEDAIDLSATYVFTSGTFVADGLFYNWLDMPYTDMSQPWWINGINDNFSIGDCIYTAVGDMCLSTLKLTYAMFYNRTLGANYDINFSDIKDMIDNGTWTIDNFTVLTRDIYSDVNGDSKADSGDIYGFAAENATNLDIWTFAFGIPMISKDTDGIPQIVLNTPKTVTAVEKINALYWDGAGSYIATSDYEEPITMFAAGNVLFTTTYLSNAFDTFREMKDEYSILPYPKFDEAQEMYLSGAMDNYSVLGIPVTVSDTEFVSIITEALNIESYKTLFPTYYVQALQNKYARDEDSIAMIDLIMQGRNFDLATLLASQVNGLPYIFRDTVSGKKTDFESAYAKKEKGAIKGLQKVVESYEKNE